MIVFFIVNILCICIWSKIISFPEPINEITGLRAAGKTTESKQRNIWQRVKKIAINIENAKNNENEECEECLKKGSGDIRIKRLLNTNIEKKQYSRGIENRITYDIISKSDIPQTFYYRPFIDSNIDIMNELIYSIEIDESPLQDLKQSMSIKQAIAQKTKKELFKLIIQSEQPLSDLNQIQKDYKKSGGDIIAAYNKLNGIDKLQYVQSTEIIKLIQKYELNKPYYSRHAVGNIPIIICNEYIDIQCNNKYLINFNENDNENSKNIKISVKYPLIPGELVIAPTFLIKLDSPNLIQHSMGYKKWWDCSDQQKGAENCIYKLVESAQKFITNQPIQGTVRIGKGQRNGDWIKCGDKKYKEMNRNLCAIKLKDIWPSTISRINIEIMHPPKYDGEYASIEFEQIPPKVHYFTTNTKNIKNTDDIKTNKMKNICFGDITKCKNKYYGGTTANIAGSTTNIFLSKSWSKISSIKLQNRVDKLPLQSEMYYKMKATFISSTIWRKYLGFSYQPPFIDNELIFDLKAPKLEQLKIECQFEPKQIMIGQTLEIYVSVKNKQNGFLRSRLKSIYKSESRLTNKYQNIDIILTPIGNGNGDNSNIGLEAIKNIVQIRKRAAITIKKEVTPGKFKVISGGKQCISFEIKGIGKTYYKDKKPECIDVIGQLKAEYIGKAKDNDINTIINHQQSDKFELIIKTGSETKLNGKLMLTPKINGDNIKPYQFNINPPILDTKTCKTDCILPFDFTPKLICAYNDNSNEFKINMQITWTVSYVVNGRNVYFPNPSPMKLIIIEQQFNDNDELLDFQEKYPEKYKRWKKCQDSIKDINILPPCNQIENGTDSESETKVEIPINCIPTDEIDDDDEILKEIENEKIKQEENLKWWQNFWQYNWNWQYVVIGSATVFIVFNILKQIGCIGGQSILLEMLENMTFEPQS